MWHARATRNFGRTSRYVRTLSSSIWIFGNSGDSGNFLLRHFLSRVFGFRVPAFCRGVFDLGIDLAAGQQREA